MDWLVVVTPAFGIAALALAVAVIVRGYVDLRRVSGEAGRTGFYGYMGVLSFLAFSVLLMLFTTLPSLRAFHPNVRSSFLMALASLVLLFWFLAFREIGRMGRPAEAAAVRAPAAKKRAVRGKRSARRTR